MELIGDIRSQSQHLFETERAAASGNPETTPVLLSDDLIAFCSSLSSGKAEFVPVVDDPNGLYGWCSDGVSEKIKVDGGSLAFGWTIWEWPEIMWTAEFHAVWVSPSGELKDITPKPGREESILFIVDSSFPQDFNFDYRPRNRRRRIYEDKDKRAIVTDLISKMKPAQHHYELRRAMKYGVSLEEWVGNKIPNDRLPALIDAVISSCDEHESYFDTLGTSGMIRADTTIMNLVKKRVQCLAALRRELDGADRVPKSVS